MVPVAKPSSRALPSRPAGRRLARAVLVVWTLAVAACGTVAAPQPTAQAPTPAPAPATPVPTVAKVALLLPLSGPNAGLGQAMQDAAQLALFDISPDRFELLPRDTKGTPQGAAEAARAVLADGAQVIIGPLFAPEVAAVKPIAEGAHVEVLAFSTDWTLAGNGTHILGFVPADQVARVIGFARSRGITRFSVLAPRSAYGEAVVNAAQASAQRYAAQITQVERYDPALADATQIAGPLAQSPQRGDAVMLAEGGTRVQQIAAALAAAGAGPQSVRLLGTGLWDDAAIGREPALAGAWFAAPAPAPRADFEARFEALYGKKPPRIATLAWDATALTAKLTAIRGPAGLSRQSLTDPSGFEGVDGLLRLRPSGLSERGLAVLEVTANGPQVVDPAPTTFATLGQ